MEDFKEIQLVKKGDFFRRKEGAKKTFIRQDYNRSVNAYTCQNFDDINDYIYIKKGKQVFVNFEF